MPGEFLPVLQSGETEAFGLVLRNEAEAQEFIALVMRHSSHLNAQLTSGEVYFLLMIENTAGSIIGND